MDSWFNTQNDGREVKATGAGSRQSKCIHGYEEGRRKSHEVQQQRLLRQHKSPQSTEHGARSENCPRQGWKSLRPGRQHKLQPLRTEKQENRAVGHEPPPQRPQVFCRAGSWQGAPASLIRLAAPALRVLLPLCCLRRAEPHLAVAVKNVLGFLL